VYVNITHSSQREGIRRTPVYFMTVTVKFSETERAIIKARHLKEIWAAVAPGVLNFSHNTYLQQIGIFFILTGIVVFSGRIYSHGLFLLFVGIIIEIIDRYLTRSERDSVSIKDLLSGPVIIRTHTPLSAREAHETMRMSLHFLKNYIDGSASLAVNETFEL